ncbi:MAG: YggT family protein [Thermoleophilia bacterium]|nr:YggT family protein [Thermoleophilia bacterium]
MDLVIDYVSALFTVYLIIIFIRILLSWIPATPTGRVTGALYRFFHDTTDWYLNIFRRVIPPIGMFDLSPIVALIVLYILNNLVIRLLESF